jgi:catechol 2,3-dioxygenase-like lactoylglutathione lyase family enzyme
MDIRLLILETARLEELKDFYSQVLGWPPTDEEDGSFTLELQKSELEFRQHTGDLQPFYHFAINIPANKIEEAHHWLQSKGIELLYLDDYKSDIAEFVNWNARSVYFFDAAGNIVELIARFDLDNATGQPFSASQFISVSEVGIVVPPTEMESKAEEFLDSYRLSWFSKQPPLENFKAVGDDEGLFIMVPEHRNWYPTQDRPAMMAPLKIYFSAKGRHHLLEFTHEWQTLF